MRSALIRSGRLSVKAKFEAAYISSAILDD
jgi:hypothetical protein